MKQCNLYNLEAEFKTYLKNNSFSRTSINNYLADFRHFISWLVVMLKKQGLSFEPRYFDKKTFELYKKSLENEKMSTRSVNRRLSTLRTFIRFCITQGWVSTNPLEDINNIKISFFDSIYTTLKNNIVVLLVVLFGLAFVLILFALPVFFLKDVPIFSNKKVSLPESGLAQPINQLSSLFEASTSANILTIPVVDARGNLNLTAPYPKIIGLNGTLTIEAPSLEIKTLDAGNINLNAVKGSLNFIFEGEKPPLPYDAAFNFSARNLERGVLIYGQTESTSENVHLLELSSGFPKESKFTVDSQGNVHVKGNIVVEGNIIMSPESVIFGRMSSQTATSSYSPEP